MSTSQQHDKQSTESSTSSPLQYWLMKTEPTTYSFADLQAAPNQTTMWEGVRNYQARNFMRDAMQFGDGVLIYHSNCKPPGVVGLARVASSPYPDPTQFDPQSPYYDEKSTPAAPRWMLVDVQAVRSLANIVPLADIKAEPRLQEMKLVQKGNRLSILPVTLEEARIIIELAGDTLE